LQAKVRAVDDRLKSPLYLAIGIISSTFLLVASIAGRDLAKDILYVRFDKITQCDEGKDASQVS
jgi:hypothetical protein